MSLRIDDISVAYGATKVLHNLTTHPIQQGSFVGLIGPNASGKSTLFKTITGIKKADEGKIAFNDQSLSEMTIAQRAKHIAYLPQSYECNAALTVFESILLALKHNAKWRVTSEDLVLVEQILNELGISHLSDKDLSELSGGQKQMAAVARTLVRKPDIVLLDEPTSALDLHHQLSIMTMVKKKAVEENFTVIAALHDLNLAAEFCDELILLRNGNLVAQGAPEMILSLKELGQTYKVHTQLEKTQRESLYVDAQLS
ncbi:ABC transporter ATP-binding protein [Vibrio sp. SCSIO 43132]|uniref:ABC transporter ATP-binding protein n=1 Tax=Vibrio sp. SCSIO 43132 TaxID=2779363 RepID=UPI001CA976F8|nr:ABC transporter ATP-binding protein [Vibrio sp. SCSIO 43132]UAB73334.1 ABC transporter ATP-binding protein [Vibrio sp. SCSIO 43132]